MKTKTNIRTFLLAGSILLAVSSNLCAQTYDYTVDWSDTSTYHTTCGKIVPAQWSVKDDSCLMWTPFLRVEASEGCMVTFSFRINQSGNGDPTDRCYVWHAIDENDWVLDTLFVAGGSPAVYPYTDSVALSYSHYIRFRIAMRTNSKTEFWAIKGGDIEVTDGVSTQRKIVAYPSRPPAPQESLPVELVSFNGKAENGSAVLNWATVSETNNDFYTIEKSINGISFEDAGNIDGAGYSNSLINYQYIDNIPFNVTYYRLKQTDYDGQFSYSGIISVKKESINEIRIIVSALGNILNINANTHQSGEMSINIYNLGSSLVYQEKVKVVEGSNMLTIEPEAKNNSIYIVSVSLNNQLPVTSKVYLN